MTLQRLSLPGIVTATDRAQELLRARADGRDAAALDELLAVQVARIDRALARPGVSADSFGDRARRAAGWLRWLDAPGNVERHVAALRRADLVAADVVERSSAGRTGRASARLRRARSRRALRNKRRGKRADSAPASHMAVVFFDTSALVRGRRVDGDTLAITINQGFVDAPPDVLAEVIAVANGATGAPRTAIRDWARGDAFRAVLLELEAVLWAPTMTDGVGSEGMDGATAGASGANDDGANVANAHAARLTRGAHHDLAAARARVAERYFGGAPPETRLRWSKRTSRRKLGYYDFTRREIVISRALDAAEVPAEIVDFVVYHELLHAVHGLRHSGTRRLAHTAAFRRDERGFAGYERVQAWLRGWGRRGGAAGRGGAVD